MYKPKHIEKCKTCYYWRADGTMWHYCHYMIDNGHSRSRTDDDCLSWENREGGKMEHDC